PPSFPAAYTCINSNSNNNNHNNNNNNLTWNNSPSPVNTCLWNRSSCPDNNYSYPSYYFPYSDNMPCSSFDGMDFELNGATNSELATTVRTEEQWPQEENPVIRTGKFVRNFFPTA